MTRRRRSLVAWLAAFALLFAQLAVSAHACAVAGQSATPHSAAAHPEGCPQADTNLDLCAQHCQYGAASVDIAKPVPAIDAATGPVVAVLAAPRHAGPGLPVPAFFLPAPRPPPAARPLPLRI
jgi:hypothetical protein